MAGRRKLFSRLTYEFCILDMLLKFGVGRSHSQNHCCGLVEEFSDYMYKKKKPFSVYLKCFTCSPTSQ